MTNQNNIERELNTIRSELYEETKDMTPSERIAYYKALAAPIRKEYDIRTVNEIKADDHRTAL
jgi:hypothetical protein